MKKSTKGLIAGVAGVALLSGGATFALWGDQATVSGGSITNGDLAITSTGGQWADVSAGAAKNIDPVTFRTIPGDKLSLTQTATIVATGNNMAATLTATGGTPASELAAKGVTATYSVFKGSSTTPVTGGANVPLGNPANITIPKTGAAGDVYTIKINADFPTSTAGRQATAATLNLGSVTFAMNQVRA